MKTAVQLIDRSREMEEGDWWDLWNSSFRSEDHNDQVSVDLFKRAAAVANEISRQGGGRLLEIGCGTGVFSRLLTYSSYCGLDLSPAAVAIAQHKAQSIERPAGASLPAYEVADFHDWPLPPEPFDLVVCVDAIAYFRDQRLVLKKISQSLRTNGRLLVTTINPFVFTRIRRMWENGPVSHWLSRTELRALVESAGLKIESSYTVMPRGHLGILRLINARRLNQAFGPRVAAFLFRLKERLGLGQYRFVVARKTGL